MHLFKKFILFTAVLLIFSACTENKKTRLHAVENIKGQAVYGDSIREGNVFDLGALETLMQKQEKADMRLKGVIADVCPGKGKWVTMKMPNGEAVRVTFRGNSFAVPQSVKGKEVLLNGYAYRDTVALATGSTVAAPVSPERPIAFLATGLVVL